MSRFTARGVSIEVPPGWEAASTDGGFEVMSDGSRQGLTIHLASFPLPAEPATFGENAVERMRSDDTLLILFEYGPESAGTPLFSHRGVPRLDRSMFSRNGLQRGIPGQTGTQYFFTERGRAFCLYVVLGSHIDRADLIPRVNAVLESMEIG